MAITTTRYLSPALGRYVTFTAVIPFEDYDLFMNKNEHPFTDVHPLPALYLLHGITGDDRDWIYGTQITEFAREHRLAVIMPDGQNNFYVDNNPCECWGRFIGEELVAMTRAFFPLSDRREDTYIGGLSMGGYGALRNGLRYSHTFSKIIALSSALIMEDAINSTEEAEVNFSKRSYYNRIFGGDVSKLPGSDMDIETLFLKNQQPTDIFMAVGKDDFLLGKNRKFKKFLEDHGASLTYYEDEGGHEWNFWNRNIEKALQWLSSGEKSSEKYSKRL